MKRTKIGSLEIDTNRNVFITKNKTFSKMRQNEVRCYAYLDLLQTKANFTTNEQELQAIFNEMDKYYIASCLCQQFGDDSKLLENSAYYFFNFINEGKFDFFFENDFENEKRNNYICSLFNALVEDIINFKDVNTELEEEQKTFWKKNILDLNYFCVNFEKSEKENTSISIQGDVDFVEQFKNSSDVYCYTECNIENLSTRAKTKRIGLNRIRYYLDYANVNLDYDTQTIFINSKIYETTEGRDADFEVNCLKEYKNVKSKIGDFAAVIAIIGQVISILVQAAALAVGVINIVSALKKAKEEETQSVVNDSANYMPSTNDFLDLFDSDSDGKIDTKWYLIFAGLLGMIYYYC